MRYEKGDQCMLILSRKKDESVIIGDEIKITILDISSNQIRLGIEAPKEINILREELLVAVEEENARAIEVNLTGLDQMIKKFQKTDQK